jgi:hypothetical protein
MTNTLHTRPAWEWAPLELSFDEAKSLLHRAVDENGAQTVYHRPADGCVYFNEDTRCPSCLIGHVLHYKGVPYEVLDLAVANRETDVSGLITDGILRLDLATESLLAIAQEHQDNGIPWGRAVALALEEYPERVEAMESAIEGQRPLLDDLFGGPV